MTEPRLPLVLPSEDIRVTQWVDHYLPKRCHYDLVSWRPHCVVGKVGQAK